ncbi:MAG TPA: hypothetical protein PK252_12535 [Bacteroidales bacterium]|nr:hypothetical protein [Bacteroidales bacterium]
MKTCLFISFLLLILYSCEPEKNSPNTIAEGYIYHSGTKKPLKGVTVYIYDGLPGSSKGSNRIDSTHTDAFGFFHVELSAEEPVLDLYKENYDFEYTVEGAVIGIVPLNVGNNLNLKFELDAYAYFKPYCLQGRNCNENDTVWYGFGRYINVPYAGNYLGNGPHTLNTWPGDKGRLVKGDKYAYYWLKYQIKGEWHERIDSVYVPSFTTWADTIFY